jgi:mono/diheme cytochrome c family protein
MKPSAPFVDATATVPGAPVASAAGGDPVAGKLVYERICTPCHGENGKGGHAEGAVLSDNIGAQTVMTVATTGRKEMPSFEQTLTEKERRDVAAYVAGLLAK